MPQIPDNFVQGVMPQGQIAPQRVEASPADFGGQVGATLQQASGQEMQQAVQRQQLENETVVNDTINNKFFPAFQDQYQKYYALQGKDAVDQLPDFQQSMRDLVQQYRDGMSNPMQQRMFDQETSRRLQYEFSGMGRYADQQNKIWQAQTNEATIDRIVSSTSDKYNDPQVLLGGLTAVSKQVAKYGILVGQSPEVIKDLQQKAMSKLYATVVERQSLDPAMGPEVANATFQDGIKRGFISGQEQLDIASRLKSRLQIAEAGKFVDGLTTGAPSAAIGPGTDTNPAGWKPPAGKSIEQERDALLNAIAGKESGNQPGAPNTDANGLPGRFQFQEGTWETMSSAYNTAVNKSATGPLDHNDANELAVAKWQIGEWLKDGYSPAQVASMWNSGHPDWAGRAGVNQSGKKFDVPGYVGSVLGNYERMSGNPLAMVADASGATVPISSPGEGNTILPAKPPAGGWTAEALQAALPGWEQQIAQRFPDNWQAQNQALSILRSKVGMQISFLAKQSQADENTLWRTYADPNGPQDLQGAMQVPAFATAYHNLLQSNPRIAANFSDMFARKTGRETKGTATPLNEQTVSRYWTLEGQAELDPEKFANYDLSSEYSNVPLNLLDRLHTLQTHIRAQIAGQEARNSSVPGALKAVQPALTAAGIYNPVLSPQKQPKEYSEFVGRFGQALNDFEAQNKRGPKDPELQQMATTLLQKVTVPGRIYGSTTEPLFRLQQGDESRAQMPQEAAPAFEADFKKVYGRAPFPGELDQLYFALKLHPGDKGYLKQIDTQIRTDSLNLIHGGMPARATIPSTLSGIPGWMTPGPRGPNYNIPTLQELVPESGATD